MKTWIANDNNIVYNLTPYNDIIGMNTIPVVSDDI